MDRFTLFNIKIHKIKLFYSIAHILGFLCGIAMIILSVLKGNVEDETIGKFDLHVTHFIQDIFYIATGVLFVTIAVGYLAQRRPDKSSLWIWYCIILLVVSLALFITSLSSFTISRAHDLMEKQLKHKMEDYQTNKRSKDSCNMFQTHYKCCGSEGYQDWQNVGFGRTSLRVPRSCCLPGKRNNTLEERDDNCGINLLPFDNEAETKIYTRGCREPALREVRRLMQILSGLGFGISATHTFLSAITFYFVVMKIV